MQIEDSRIDDYGLRLPIQGLGSSRRLGVTGFPVDLETSSIFNLQSAIRNPQSAICNLQSAISWLPHLDNQDERGLSSEAIMDEPTTDVIQGTLDMLILKTLSLEPMHGFGIARRVEQVSRGVFKVNPGSLLTALQRLERAGWLDAEWRQTENSRRARFYTLTRAGRKQLEMETADWTRRAAAIARLLKAEA
jgi:PadR family transcriptional regulator PadR